MSRPPFATHRASASNSPAPGHRGARPRRGSVALRSAGESSRTSSPARTEGSPTHARIQSMQATRSDTMHTRSPSEPYYRHSPETSISWGRHESEEELLGKYRHRSEESSAPAMPSGAARFSLRNWRWGVITRLVRSPRRVLWFVVALLLIVALLLTLHDAGDGRFRLGDSIRWLLGHGKPDPPPLSCRFVSPVEAYRHDLARLRELYPNGTASPHSRPGHVFSPTGHLIMSADPAVPHPIPQLIALGEKRWEEILSRQSRTLGEAVREYKHRYRRNPPRGFDKWWEFAMEHNVVLPDEYDRINVDLEPFWALPRDELKRRIEFLQSLPGVLALEVKDQKVVSESKSRGRTSDRRGEDSRAKALTSLMHSLAGHLPDLSVAFSLLEQPQIYLPWTKKASLLHLARSGQHDAGHLDETSDISVNFPEMCSSDSNLGRGAKTIDTKSFVSDSLQSRDICLNPYLVPIHSMTIEPHTSHSNPKPHAELLPLFSTAKTIVNSDILVPLYQGSDKVHDKPTWEEKLDSRLAWRGKTTGISMMTQDLPWQDSHRIRLHRFANNMTEEPCTFIVPDFGQDVQVDSEVSDVGQEQLSEEPHPRRAVKSLGYKKEVQPRDILFDHFFDVKLIKPPVQCDTTDGTCDAIDNEVEWAPERKAPSLHNYKFILDVDGNGVSEDFQTLIRSNSLIIKSTLFAEWYQPHLIPWFMYVPAKLDYSDLPDIMAFFAGSPSHPSLAFDETAKALATNGQCFAERMLREVDVQAYMFRLMLEYSRLAHGEDGDFHYDPAVHGDPGMEYEDVEEEPEMPEEAMPTEELPVEQVQPSGHQLDEVTLPHEKVKQDSAPLYDGLKHDQPPPVSPSVVDQPPAESGIPRDDLDGDLE